MRTIMSYPGFSALPAGIKTMLLVSESFFFAEARPVREHRLAAKNGTTTFAVPTHLLNNRFASFGSAWRN